MTNKTPERDKQRPEAERANRGGKTEHDQQQGKRPNSSQR